MSLYVGSTFGTLVKRGFGEALSLAFNANILTEIDEKHCFQKPFIASLEFGSDLSLVDLFKHVGKVIGLD